MLQVMRHKSLFLLLSLAVVLAPVSSAVAAINMLQMVTNNQSHCHLDANDKATQHASEHANCCQQDEACQDACSSCTHCFSAHAMLVHHFASKEPVADKFNQTRINHFKDTPPDSGFRPPRLPA